MNRIYTRALLVLLLSVSGISAYAQFTISGKVLSHTDKKPVPDASIFLSNASVGAKTQADGTFILTNAKPGKYELVVSVVGFEAFSEPVIISGSNIIVPDIEISPRAIDLNEVTIKSTKRDRDPFKARNLDWFKNEFLGSSYLAKECKILNPNVLDISYDEDAHILTASSYDFLEIENDGLGYKIKYLLTNFTMNNKDEYSVKVHFQGSVLFEKMKGSPAEERRWQMARQEIYEGSEMHFLRSALADKVDENGFRVLELTKNHNADRPQDSVRARKLMNIPLAKKDIVKPTEVAGIYTLGYNDNALHITYNKKHHFPKSGRLTNLDYATNTDVTLLNFTSPTVMFDSNGGVLDPNGIVFSGAWGRHRVAELLPLDYEPEQAAPVVQKSNSTQDNITAKLKNFLEQRPAEKAYLQFDKPYYATGDTIYFKAYVTLGDEHKLSDLSGVLNVDLINTANKIDQSIKLQLVDGVSWGDFALPDSLPKGNYRVRAYTQWMQNEGDAAYFNQTIPVGSIHSNKVPESATRSQIAINAKPDLQLLPEGGQLVTGIKTKVAFKAVAGSGIGTDVKGKIVDNENKEVASFASAHLGMGSFAFTPETGKTYKAKLTYADGSQNTVDLPQAADKGIVLTVNNDSLPKAAVRIEASKAYYQENKNKDFTLVIYSGGTANTVTCMLDQPLITLDILKRKLQTGVATVTLFSPAGDPLCERLLFIQNYDQLNIAVNSDKATYAPREKVNIKLNIKTRADLPSAGHFSVAVVDESKVPANENMESTLLTNILLTSDLKGNIEQPNYYFNNISPKTLADLDLVMLTHGYRKFEWKQLLNNTYPALAYKPEKNLEVAGTAKSMLGKPLDNAMVSLIKKRDGSFLRDTTDDKGRFHFSNLVFMDTDKFILQAININKKNNTKLVYDQQTEPAVSALSSAKADDTNQSLSPYLENAKKQEDDIAKYGTFNGKMLKDVTIKGKHIKQYPSSATSLVSPEFADQVIMPDEMAKGGPFGERIRGVLRGIFIRMDSVAGTFAYRMGGRSRMRVIVDGVETDGNLDEVLADEVESVEVLRFASTSGAYSSFAGSTGMNKGGTDGILIVNTKKTSGLQVKDIATIGLLPIRPKGYYVAREFYSPKYTSPLNANSRPDLRSTIFWKPEMVTDKDGNTSFTYNNADGHGTYRLVVEGIDDNGNLGRQVYRYKVE